ncbi:hypothetical protein ACXR0O_16045 [Verrucomicrobiota bacterium sgz303538]
MAQDFPEELPRNRFWLKCAVVLILLGVLGFVGNILYRRWEPERLAKQARRYFEEGKSQDAALTARRALQINPFNESASRLMAEITEKLKVPDAVDWRQRVAELNKNSSADALAWAGAALRAGRTSAAQQALAAVPEAERNSAPYHAAAGATAITAGRAAEAERHFSEAVRLDPENELYQYNLATLQIQLPDPAKRQAGSQTLDRLGKGGRAELFAKRSRVTQLRGERNDAEALRVSWELVQLASSEFPDRLKHLDLLHRLNRPEWQSFAEDLQKRATQAVGEDAAALATWMRENVGPAESLAFIETLQAQGATHPRVRVARAEGLVDTKQWPALQTFAGEGSWESLDYMRLAYLSRALREQGDTTGARTRWTSAVGTARRREPLSQLAWLAARWEWTSELREVLWAAANTPAPQWALQMLHRSYLAEKDSGGVLRVAQKAVEVDAQNDSARNNVTALSLLLGRDRERAMESARKLYEKHSEDPGFASTYALGLHLAGRSAEGLSVMKKLAVAQLREPSIAAYYGVLLAANGAPAEALEYLKLSETAPLLPEESALVAAARETRVQ